MLSPGREAEHTYPRRAGAAAQKGGETATAQAGGEVEEQGSAAKCFRGDAVQCSAGLKNTDIIALSGLLCLFSSRFFPLDALDGCVEALLSFSRKVWALSLSSCWSRWFGSFTSFSAPSTVSHYRTEGCPFVAGGTHLFFGELEV